MNVLMLVVDSLRRDFCFGDHTDTPTVDRLQNEGTTFDQAISSATWTPPCMGSIFSGIYPHRLGMYDFSTPYPDDVDSLFAHFSDAGYEVGSFVFDENYLFKEVPEANVIDNFRDYSKPKQWIREQNDDDDFFLFVHHYWVHGPYEPQDSAEAWSDENEKILQNLREDHEKSVKKYKEKYQNAVEEMSENWLRGLLDTLDKEGTLEDTLIVFLGDHGESWGERYENKSTIQKNFHLHGALLYDELIRVPMIVRYPPAVPEGKRIQKQVRQVDIFPTIMDLAGLEATDSWERDGKSFIDAFSDGQPVDARKAISSATDVDIRRIEKMSIRSPEEKLIWTISTDNIELYDLDEDPEETTNVAESRPERVKELKGQLQDELSKAPKDKTVDDSVRDHLKDLGYL